MDQVIGQRELRNDNAEIMRRVEAGESFTVTRNGRPVADLVPHQEERAVRRRTVGELQAQFRRMTPVDGERWCRERVEADAVFGLLVTRWSCAGTPPCRPHGTAAPAGGPAGWSRVPNCLRDVPAGGDE